MSRPRLQEEQAQLSMWIRADLRKALSGRAVKSGESQKTIVERALESYLRTDDPAPLSDQSGAT